MATVEKVLRLNKIRGKKEILHQPNKTHVQSTWKRLVETYMKTSLKLKWVVVESSRDVTWCYRQAISIHFTLSMNLSPGAQLAKD